MLLLDLYVGTVSRELGAAGYHEFVAGADAGLQSIPTFSHGFQAFAFDVNGVFGCGSGLFCGRNALNVGHGGVMFFEQVVDFRF